MDRTGGNKVGGGASASLFLLSIVLDRYLPERIAGLVAVLSLAGVFYFGLRWLWEQVGRPTGTFPKALFFLAAMVSIGAVGAFAWHVFQTEKEEKQRPAPDVTTDRPKLRVRLVPERLSGETISAHVLVKNDGPGDVEVLRYRIEVPDHHSSDERRPERRLVPDGDELTLEIKNPNSLATVRNLYLTMLYKALATGQQRTRRYRFKVPVDLVGPIPPAGSDEREGVAWLPNEYEQWAQAFTKSAYVLDTGFREQLNGVPNVVTFAAHGRSISINGATRTVEFTTSRTGKLRRFKASFVTAPVHQLTLSWDDAERDASVVLDGHRVEEVKDE